MEVKPGYKQTEVGVIPEEWDVKPLGEIGGVRMCKRVLKHQTREHGDVPFYKIGTFGGGADAFISQSLFDELRRKYSFPRNGDILISAAGTIGRTVAYNGAPAYFQDSNIVWIDNDESKATNAYLWHRYQVTKWSISHGGTVARLYNDSLRTKIHIPIPPLPEQRAIATALSDVDGLLSGLDRLIAKKRDLKQAAMQQLLTGQTRLPGFHGEWELKTLGAITARLPKTTRLSSDGKPEGRFPFFTNSTQPVDKYLDDKDFDQEVIIANTGGVAYFDYFNGPFAAMSDCMVLTAQINTKWLFYLLKALESSIDNKGFTGSGIKHLDKEYFFDLSIRMPKSTEEQASIAYILTDIDSELEALEARRDKTRELKQAMMQELLTGRIRLLQPGALHA